VSICQNNGSGKFEEVPDNSPAVYSGCMIHNPNGTDDIDIYLQVQVMPNAPYDILLGRPFYALTECITKDFANRDQHLTVTDPNTRKCITIPTREQKRHQHPHPDF
jgi:hypothetical protein